MFSNQRDSTIGLLILRHLLEGGAIDYPIAKNNPRAPVFLILEQNGYIERWDRFWPLSDRYRLTARGTQAIQSTYNPASAMAVMSQLSARRLAPQVRPQALRAMGYDPGLWPILHDPKAQWSTWPEQIGPFQRYVWEASLPPQQRPAQPQRQGQRPAQGGQPRPAGARAASAAGAAAGSMWSGGRVVHHHHHHTTHEPHDHGWQHDSWQGSEPSWQEGSGGEPVYESDSLDPGSDGGGASYGDVS